MKSAYLVIAHGSRDSQSNEAFESFLADLKGACPDRLVQGAFLELAKPSIPEAIESCVQKGVEEIFVVPLMFFPGRHVKEDIPNLIQEAKEKHLDVTFHCAGPLSENSKLVDLIKEGIVA